MALQRSPAKLQKTFKLNPQSKEFICNKGSSRNEAAYGAAIVTAPATVMVASVRDRCPARAINELSHGMPDKPVYQIYDNDSFQPRVVQYPQYTQHDHITVPIFYTYNHGYSHSVPGYQQNWNTQYVPVYYDEQYSSSQDYSHWYDSHVASWNPPYAYQIPLREPLPEPTLLPETISGRTYTIQAELRALQNLEEVLDSFCITSLINLENEDRESILRMSMDRLTGKIKPTKWSGEYDDFAVIYDVIDIVFKRFMKSKILKMEATRIKQHGESMRDAVKRLQREKLGPKSHGGR